MNQDHNLISKDKIKDVLVSRTAGKVNVDTAIVEKVVGFAFKDAAKAFKKNNTVEISGFGVFRVSLSKLKKDLIRRERNLANVLKIPDQSNSNVKNYVQTLETIIADVKTKINELEKD